MAWGANDPRAAAAASSSDQENIKNITSGFCSNYGGEVETTNMYTHSPSHL